MLKKGILLFSLFILTLLSTHQTQCAHVALRRTAATTARTLFSRAGQRNYASSSYSQHSQSTSPWRQRMRRLATFAVCASTVAWHKDALAEQFNAHAVKFLPHFVITPLIALGCTEIVMDPETNRTILHTAAFSGEEKIVALLILHKAQLDQKDAFATTPLFAALTMGHVRIAKMLIAAGADTSNLRTKNGDASPLHIACSQNNIDIKKLRGLLVWQRKRNYAEIDVNAQDEDGDTPLILAMTSATYKEGEEQHKLRKFVKLLLKHGANPFLRNHNNLCAYHIANAVDDKELIDAFNQVREIQAELEAESGSQIFTSLHEAAAHGSEDAAHTLVRKGYSLDAKDKMGLTVLFVALLNGHTSVAEIMLDGGANNLTAPDTNQTVLHVLAADPRVLEQLEKILEWQQKRNWREVNPNTPANAGITPLMLAALAGNILAINVLHRYGADLAQKDTEGKTAADYAMSSGEVGTRAFIDTLTQKEKNEEGAQGPHTEPSEHDEESLS